MPGAFPSPPCEGATSWPPLSNWFPCACTTHEVIFAESDSKLTSTSAPNDCQPSAVTPLPACGVPNKSATLKQAQTASCDSAERPQHRRCSTSVCSFCQIEVDAPTAVNMAATHATAATMPLTPSTGGSVSVRHGSCCGSGVGRTPSRAVQTDAASQYVSFFAQFRHTAQTAANTGISVSWAPVAMASCTI